MSDEPSRKHDPATPEEAEQILKELAGALDPALAGAIPSMMGVVQSLPEPQDTLTGELYRTLLEQIPAVTFMSSFEQGLQKVYVSPQIHAVLGYTKEEWLANPSLWYERLHPEDKERWNREFAATVISRGKAVRSVYRFRHRDGRTVWILGDVRIKRDEKTGFPLFVQAVGFDVTELEEAREELRRAKEREIAAQKEKIARLQSEIQREFAPDQLLGSSEAMERLRALIRKVAPTDATVLIAGESGTGKELVARAIHYTSPRTVKEIVDVNCAAITETLLESELFGVEKDKIPGVKGHIGKFEQADGGTIFLDEIGDMPPAIQAKMLRVLQEKSFQRVMGQERVQVDVRVICATNRDLEEEVRKGTFRQDLLYRVNMVVLKIPPLRERTSDIPELVHHFLARSNRVLKRQAALSPAALDLLASHAWPGNVRELRNAVEQAVLFCDGDVIRPEHLPPAVTQRAGQVSPALGRGPIEEVESLEQALVSHTLAGEMSLKEAVERMERALILAALDQTGWVKTRAAKLLGLNERVLTYKMNNLGIEKAQV